MLTRREVLVSGSAVVLGSAVIWSDPSAALNLGKIFKGVATTIVHGVNAAAQPIQQLVSNSTRVLEQTVREAGNSIDVTRELINSIEKSASTIAGEVNSLAQQGVAQAIPLFVNMGFQTQQLDFLMSQSAKLLSLSSSSEQELRADPHRYVDQNTDLLTDYVRTFPMEAITKTYNAPVGQPRIGQIPVQVPNGKGYYASVLSVADLIKLVTLIAAL